MAKSLVIIEAPGKVGKFRKVLGTDYEVLATVGHCVDLPVKGLSVNIKKKFEPTWEVIPGKKAIVKKLKAAAKKAKNIYLMTDQDREGEMISAHIFEQIKDSTKANIHRAITNEITAKGIKDAIANPGSLDEQKIDAYLVRRILDRIVGYKTSFLTKQSTGGRSAGRVQSAMLRIIVDREKEIIHFIPEEYWVLTAYLLSSKGNPYTGVLTEKIKVPNEEKATEIYDAVIKGKPVVDSVETKDVNVRPFAPFTTLPMQATAATVLGWSGSKTMKVAQGLYENGYITYMRTDSPHMAQDAVKAIRDHVLHKYGTKYLPAKAPFYKAKKSAQEAHEACRVTDVNAEPHLVGDDAKLYDLIRRRTVASQMCFGTDRRMKVITKIAGYDFVSRGNRIIFDGFRKCWTYGGSKDLLLPDLQEGEKVSLTNLLKEQKFTSPLPRYSTASLAKKCEDAQVGRPATFASFIETLVNRGYITKKGKSFQATDLGIKVIDFLVASDFAFVSVSFTASMEDLLDDIQNAKKDKLEVLTEFWERLKKDIENAKSIKKKQEVTQHKCPKCGGFLLLKQSFYGPFFSCQNYKPPKKVKGKKVPQEGSCSYKANVGENNEPIEKEVKKKEYADFSCECGGKMVKRQNKKGEFFFGCENFSKTPQCKCTASLEGVFSKSKKKDKKK